MTANPSRFGTAGWFEALFDVAAEMLREVDLDGSTFVFSEEFTDPPAELIGDGKTALGWHFRIDGAGLTIASGPAHGADVTTVADFATIEPIGLLRYSDPDELAQYQRRVGEAMAAGTIRVTADTDVPPEVAKCLVGIHDVMAELTLGAREKDHRAAH